MRKILFLLCYIAAVAMPAWTQPSGTLRTIAANAKKGFEWDYLLYVPDSLDKSRSVPILFTMNDSGIFDTVSALEQATRERFGRGNEDYIAYETGVPMVLPLILRSEGKIDSHDLNRAAFLIEEGPLKRLDEQVIAMLKDARKQLKKEGIRTDKKFLVAGFSSAGAFGWKLALLQPKEILAVAVGGEMYPALPAETLEGEKLLFPVGVYDMKAITGKKFDLKAWRKIPILLTNGSYDYNDPLNALYGQEDGDLVLRVFGKGTLQNRWERARFLLGELAPNVQTYTYPKTEHEPVQQDMISFLKKHMKGEDFHPIVLTDTSDKPEWLPLQVSGLYWGKQTPLTQDREYLGDTDLMLEVPAASVPFWLRFVCVVDLLQGDKTVLEGLPVRGIFSEKDSSFLQIPVSPAQAGLLKGHSKPVFSVRSRIPEVLVIPEDLTFAVQ